MSIKVRSLERQTEFCPTQWFGYAVDGRAIYARYRYSCLSVTVGKPDKRVPCYVHDGEQFGWRDPEGDGWQGVMETDELIERTRGFLDFDGAVLTDTCAERGEELMRVIKRLAGAKPGETIREGLTAAIAIQNRDPTWSY